MNEEFELAQRGSLLKTVAGYEEQFNDWYDHMHIPEVKRAAPENISVKRFNLTIISIPLR